MKTCIVAVALLLLFLAPAIAQDKAALLLQTGNDMMSAFSVCDRLSDRSVDETDAAVCFHLYGYIEGTTQALNMVCTGLPKCTWQKPHEVTNQQMYDVIRQYVTTHPADRNQPSLALITAALAEAWPKPKTK